MHSVHFYETEESLYRAVGDYLVEGIAGCEPVLVIATPEHANGFRRHVERKGHDPSLIEVADAREMLSQFADRDSLDRDRFFATIGGAIGRRSSPSQRVWAYGEMVDLLWRDGFAESAMQLESLWIELAEQQNFSLMCAYPMGHFYKPNGAPEFSRLCDAHEHVIVGDQRTKILEMEIAHRKNLEKALVRSQQDLRDFLENATIGIHRVDAEGTILWANDAELQMLGYGRDEYVGHNIREFYADREVIDEIMGFLAKGEDIRDREVRLVAKDGSIRIIELDSNAHFEDGKFVHTRCFSRDITQRKMVEATNSRLFQRAQEANRAKDEFLATLSHELRTPLTAILGWARLLLLGGIDMETTRTALQTIEQSARMQTALIDDLLDLSRVVTGKLSLNADLVDLGEVVRNAAQTQRLAADVKNVRLEVSVPEDRIIVKGDATRLQQIVWNLIVNAIKFSSARGHVGVSLTKSRGVACISVRDNGRGITPEFLPHVFEPFRQGEASTTRAFGGLGLGLAIVKYLVEAHGGTVAARSDGEGHGATFEVTLPIVARVNPDATVVLPEEEIDLAGTSVLVVDDDEATRDLLRAILRRCGAKAETVASVDEACAKFNADLDIVVTDIAMPQRDGFALLEFVRSQKLPKHVPVIALTASAQKAGRDGFDAYVCKPIDPVEFASVIARLR